jgi:two-component system sensor histidine kinase KdpD
MGGTLTAEDTPGGGLTMVISLPAAQPDRANTAADAHPVEFAP